MADIFLVTNSRIVTESCNSNRLREAMAFQLKIGTSD